METALVVYAVCAAVLLICSTLPHVCQCPKTDQAMAKGTMDYVVIPRFLLRKWEHRCSSLLIFDFHSDSARSSRYEDIPEALTISVRDFCNLVKWLLPGSRVVCSGARFMRHFDAQTESILLQCGIEAIYFLDGGTDFLLTPALDREWQGYAKSSK